MVRPPQEFRVAARDYVCVRVTNVNRIDLNEFAFDHDLTLALVLAHPDGTVYHRYGGRANLSPMNMGTLVALMKEALETHRDYSRHPDPPRAKPPFLLEDLVQRRLRGTIQPVFGCYHCHYAREARQYLALEAGEWTPDQYWIFPVPERLGLVLNQRDQNRVERVLPRSPAMQAGIEVGDELESLAGRRILTKYDVQWVLHERSSTAGRLAFVARRKGRPIEGEFVLAPQWKVGDPGEHAWRVRNVYTEHMAKFLPSPGFTGTRLEAAELAKCGLDEKAFALKIDHLNYGTHKAGIRLGDIVLAAGGKNDFVTERDFYAWCESLRSAGRDIRMEVLRQESRMNIMVPLSLLNYSRVERAPKAVLGFIVQQLSGSAGLRVGHVSDGCSAERAGLLHGDRIVKVEGTVTRTTEGITAILNAKSPGDLLTIDVLREGAPLQFGFVLGGEEELPSDVARLSEPVNRTGQVLRCLVSIKLPEGKHVYSMHRKGFGIPTHLVFRGRGYELLGPAEEPDPKRLSVPGMPEDMWILEGRVEFVQRLRVTDAQRFQLLLQVYAQVCDESSCHEFRAVLGSDGSDGTFKEYRGPFERQPRIEVADQPR